MPLSMFDPTMSSYSGCPLISILIFWAHESVAAERGVVAGMVGLASG